MGRYREDYNQNSIYKLDVFSWCFHQGRLKFLDVFRHSFIKPHSKCTKQPASYLYGN